MNRRKRGYTLLLALLFAASAALAGCSGSNAGSKGNTGTSGGGQTAAGSKPKLSLAVERSTNEEDNQFYEQLIADYNKLAEGRAEIDLQFVDFGEDGSAARTWVTTQLIGGKAPDLFRSRYLWTQEDYGKGQLADFNAYLEKPNPYADNQTWKDTFSDNILNSMVVPTTDIVAGIPTFSNSVRLFYNKDLFTEAGIADLPETWEQFEAAEEKLLAAGITPMAIGTSKQGGDRPNWMIRYFSDQTTEQLVPRLDLDKNGSVTSNEIVFGIDAGLIDFSKEPFVSLFPIMKNWTKYWPKGFNGITAEDADDMFLRGDAAMTINLPGFSKQLEGLIDYGVMRVPYLTKATHPQAAEKYYEVAAGNPDGVFAIPKTLSADKMDPAVDFLMYLTSAGAQKRFAETLYKVPILKDAEFPANIEAFLIVNEPFKMNLFGPAFSKSLYETFGLEGQLYLDGTMPLEDFAGKLNAAARKEAETLKLSQNWSKENNYGLNK